MYTTDNPIDVVRDLVQSESIASKPALVEELEKLLEKHGIGGAPQFPRQTLAPQETLLYVFEQFSHAEISRDNPTLLHGLRTALRNYVLPSFGFSKPELRKLDIALSKLPVKDFRGVEDIFINNTKTAVDSKKISKGTFSGYKSCLLRFLGWMQEKGLYPIAPKLSVAEDKRYAPRLGNGPKQKPFANLTNDRKGQRCRSHNPYSLRQDELTPRLINQLEAKLYELTSNDFNSSSLKSTTKKSIDWLPNCGLHYFLTAKEVPKRQGSSLREVTFETRRKDILRFLGWLKNYKQVKLEDLSLELMTDRNLLEEFVAWGVTERGNTYAWACQSVAASLNIAKWLYHKRSSKNNYDDIKQIVSLREYERELDKKRRIQGTNIQNEKEEKFLTFEECEELIVYLRQCCAPKRRYYHANGKPRGTASRSDRAIISSWQRYLIVAILLYCGIRQREVRELELGKTLFKEHDGYWVKQGPEHHKEGSRTGRGKEFKLPDHLTEDLNEWFSVWRPRIPLQEHDYVFATVGSNILPDSAGKPFDENSLGHFVTKGVYKATSYLFGEPKRVNPHFFRNIVITHQRKNGDPSQQESLAEMMGQSIKTADEIYNLMTLRDKTKKAQNWWKTYIQLNWKGGRYLT